MRRTLIIILFLVSPVLADPPDGYPFTVGGELVMPGYSGSATFVWNDTDAAYVASGPPGDCTLTPVFALEGDGVFEVAITTAGPSLLGLVEWSDGIVGRGINNGLTGEDLIAFHPIAVDYGYAWNTDRITYVFLCGFAAGMLMQFTLAGASYFYRGWTYAVSQIFT